MPTSRRQFLRGLLAASVIPVPTWADAGSPSYLSAAARPDGSYVLCGISYDLEVLFQIPLPDRGHAAAAHPTRPEAVAFARRPGTFAVVIDCLTGDRLAALTAPPGRHFYGHGAFSADGDWLFTTENDFDAGRGCVGVWNARAGYARETEFDSGGIGPHDIKRLPGTDTLVVANGGIDTHPGSGRAKLNLPTMRPNLAYIMNAEVQELASLPENLHKNSIRHLAISSSGRVAFGMQWQGAAPVSTLAGHHKRGEEMTLLEGGTEAVEAMQGYIGSIAYSGDDRMIAVTSPRGGLVHLYDAKNGSLEEKIELNDASGISSREGGFIVTAGTGYIRCTNDLREKRSVLLNFKWDNHLVSI